MEHNRKNSIKRSAIFNALVGSKEHPSAEMLYDQLKPLYKDLSLGTVYRNLSLFCSDKKAIVVAIEDGKERYDGCTLPHVHFICKKCHRIFDVFVPEFESQLSNSVKSSFGFQIDETSVSFRGLCTECLG